MLLDDEFRPKLSDFGLAREGPSEGQTHVSTAVCANITVQKMCQLNTDHITSEFFRNESVLALVDQVMGTYGYAAPDYVRTGHLTTKSDVWSFGVVLYEILAGRRSIDKSRPKDEQKLLEWVRRHPAGSPRFGRIMDGRLQGRYSVRAAREVAELAAGCLAKHGKDRPAMAEVVERLRRATRHAELDGEVYDDAGEESSSSPAAAAVEDDVAVAAAAAMRRMLHLAALGENASASAHARRRLMLMRAAAAATAAT